MGHACPGAFLHLLTSTWPAQTTLNDFAALGPEVSRSVRLFIKYLLVINTPILRDDSVLRGKCLVQQADATMHLPFAIGDFTDFLNSRIVRVLCLHSDPTYLYSVDLLASHGTDHLAMYLAREKYTCFARNPGQHVGRPQLWH